MCEHSLCARAPRTRMVVVYFGRSIPCWLSIMKKTQNMARISITERVQAFTCTQKFQV